MLSGAVSTFFLSRMKLTSPFLSSGARTRTTRRTPAAAGRRILVQRTSRSWPLPGRAQRCLTIRSRVPASAIVRENVLLGPAGDIEQSSGRKEVEAGLGERHSVLTLETLVELRLELMQITDIARGIIARRITELVGPPVAGL